MPIHSRATPENIVELSKNINDLCAAIYSSMDGVRLSNGKAHEAGWKIASASLYLAEQHTHAINTLVGTHNNEAAGLHLRSLFEIYVRLVYMLSAKDGSRLAATLYADTIRYEDNCKDARKTNKDGSSGYPKEYQEHFKDFEESIQKRIVEAKYAKQNYLNQLKILSPQEFLDEDNQLLKESSLKRKLSIRYICKEVDKKQIQGAINSQLFHSYSVMYGTLSMYAHTSTVYLAQVTKTDDAGSSRVGTVSEKDNEYNSVRTLAATYYYLLETFIEVMREKGESDDSLIAIRSNYESKINQYYDFLVN